MLSKNLYFGLIALVGVLMFSACGSKEYKGEDVTNYPDLENVMADNLDMTEPYIFTLVKLENGKKDSSEVSEMPWEELKALFKKANIHKDELNNQYSINLMSDSATYSRTLFYKSLNPNNFMQSMSIVSDVVENSVTSVYFETVEKSVFSSEYIKLLFIPKQLIQIHKRSKQTLSDEQQVVDTYYWP